MFIHCNRSCAVMANLRCGSTNMFNYFKQETPNGFGMRDWMLHHNPILVLRNPIDRVVSSMPFLCNGPPKFRLEEFARHSCPYLHKLKVDGDRYTDFRDINFRIIDFYDLEQYIPRENTMQEQSVRTDTRHYPTTAVGIYVENSVYTLEDLERCVATYEELIVTRERISVEEWKNLTES